jgi:hypothetical protein
VHEHRAAEAAAELGRSNHVIERLTADVQASKDKLKRKQIIIVRQARPDQPALFVSCCGVCGVARP